MICQRLRRRRRRQSSGWKPRKAVRHMITSSALPPRLPLRNNFVLTVGNRLRNHSLSIVPVHHCLLQTTPSRWKQVQCVRRSFSASKVILTVGLYVFAAPIAIPRVSVVTVLVLRPWVFSDLNQNISETSTVDPCNCSCVRPRHVHVFAPEGSDLALTHL